MAKEYRVSIDEDIVTPEETLMDSGSEFSDLERPIPAITFQSILWVIAAAAGFIFLSTARIGIAQHQYYAGLALQNRSSNFSVPPPRGIIFDSDGNPLVNNVPSFDLIAVSKEIKSLNADDPVFSKVAEILKMPVADLKNQIADQAKTAGVFFAATNLSKDQVLSLQSLKLTGLYVIPNVERSYVDGPVFSDVIGYAGKVSKDDLNKDSYYTPTDTIGRLGVEGQYEDYLRGQHGQIFFDTVPETTDTSAATGDNVALNIDSDLQKKLYDELRAILAGAGLSRGAAVVQDPRTGAVLAMVSLPSFDNNSFSNGLSQSQYDAIFNNPAQPLFNRAISGLYNPGSTIKPLMGLMGLQEKVITPETTIQDCISISVPNPYDKNIVYTYRNWRNDHGPFDLRRAIAQSCDVYFYTVGGGYGPIAGLGADRIDKYLTSAMADKNLGIDLMGESHGFVPTPDWKQQTRGQPWYQGDTYNISIGQGDLNVTPLWLNSYISAIANGGTMYKPEVANRIVDSSKNPVTIFSPQTLTKLPFSDENLKIIKDDMREVILTGTAGILKDLPVTAGAKTGTAEVIKGQSINSLFTVFAPFDHPTLSMTILVEGSHSNQGLAIITANNVLKWYFGRTASASQ